MKPTADQRARFSGRAAEYARYRPDYPTAVVATLAAEAGLRPGSVVADVGSGTGISSALFLPHGCTVYAVEPNEEMRLAAEARLVTSSRFHSVRGSAEHTTLASASVDLYVAAQASHWFDEVRAVAEARRILRGERWAALLWNTRRVAGSSFLEGFEALLQRFAIDYREVKHTGAIPALLEHFFGGAQRERRFAHEQRLDLDGLRGLLASTSYAPRAGHPDHEPMLRELERLFAAAERDGEVTVLYETELYFGPLSAP